MTKKVNVFWINEYIDAIENSIQIRTGQVVDLKNHAARTYSNDKVTDSSVRVHLSESKNKGDKK